MLRYDAEVGVTTVSSSSGRSMPAAIEDVRATICEDAFAAHVKNSNDQLERILDGATDIVSGNEKSDCLGQV